MVHCEKCNKKPDHVESKLCVVRHAYEVTATCHGQKESKKLTIDQMRQAEKDSIGVLFFANPAKVSEVQLEKAEKKSRKVGSGTLGRDGARAGSKGSEP